ncbi:MAG: hypothetical protein JO002_09505, partial [Burkholderiaceae bacterium]|nr:hypothetical protein [Burkholderiaceae bacterium]
VPRAAALCGEGYGLDLHEAMQHPPQTLNGQDLAFTSGSNMSPYCRKIDAHHPLSPLGKMLAHPSKPGQPGDEMRLLRYLFWVN